MAQSEIVDFDKLPDNLKRLFEVTYKSGQVRPQVMVKFGGFRYVAVGNRILWGKWVTFPDFLIDYCTIIVGADWGKAELAKPLDQMNPMMQWYKSWEEFAATKKIAPDGTFKAVSSGPVAAWFHLAYDLYILQHNASLQTKLVDRLRNTEQFQGARYELTIAATFIRAGFLIQLEDESDRQRKHPEFLAIDQTTNEAIAVEAKSRHRPGVLAQPGQRENPTEITAGIGRLLQNAIAKNIEMPYVVCIDLNLPPFDQENLIKQPQVRELMKTIAQKERQYPEDAFPVTVVVATNFPHYYTHAHN